MSTNRTRIIVEMALSAALGLVFYFVSVNLPINVAGGEVSLVMAPVVVLALRRGLWPGVITGVAVGLLALLYRPFIVHPVQVVLDYPAAFAAVGLSGVLSGASRRMISERRFANVGVFAVIAVGIGGLARLVVHIISGVVFFSANAPTGQPVVLYSLIYNATYMLPSVVVCAIMAAILVPALGRSGRA